MTPRRISAFSPVDPIHAILVDRLRRSTRIRLDWGLSIERIEDDRSCRTGWVFVFRAADLELKPSQVRREWVYRSPRVFQAEFGSFCMGSFKPTGSAEDVAAWIHEDILRSCPDHLRERMASAKPSTRVDVD